MIYTNKKGIEVEFDVDTFPFSSTIKHEIKGLDYAKLCEFEEWCLDTLNGMDDLDVASINETLEEYIDDFQPSIDDYGEDDY